MAQKFVDFKWHGLVKWTHYQWKLLLQQSGVWDLNPPQCRRVNLFNFLLTVTHNTKNYVNEKQSMNNNMNTVHVCTLYITYIQPYNTQQVLNSVSVCITLDFRDNKCHAEGVPVFQQTLHLPPTEWTIKF
jgi:hypothetical protein